MGGSVGVGPIDWGVMTAQAVAAELLAVVVAMVDGQPAVLTLGEPPEPGAALAGHAPKLGGEHLT